MIDLYVYYRVPEDAAAALAPRVLAMQAALGCGRLKRRPQVQDGMQTWMEVYEAVADGYAQELGRAVAAAGLAEHIAGPRHTEVFMDLTVCA